jgi:hypothetical protein
LLANPAPKSAAGGKEYTLYNFNIYGSFSYENNNTGGKFATGFLIQVAICHQNR